MENAEPSVIVKKDSSPKQPVPEKYRKDVVLLRSKYGDAFKTGFYINLTLQEALSVMPRERKIDSYRGLQSYLKRELGFTLLITSQKVDLNLQHYEKLFYCIRGNPEHQNGY